MNKDRQYFLNLLRTQALCESYASVCSCIVDTVPIATDSTYLIVFLFISLAPLNLGS